MAGDRESGLLFGDMRCQQRNGNVNIHQHPAGGAMDMVVTLDALVETARLIGERQFLDQAVLRQKVKRSIDRAVSNRRVSPADAFEDLASGEVSGGRLDLSLDDRSLGRVAIGCLRSQSHCVTFHSVGQPDRAMMGTESMIVPT